MKKLLQLSLLILGALFFGQTILESYPGSTPSIYQTNNYINFNNKMYYFGRTSGYQWSLYSTDGSATGNAVVKNLSLQVGNVIPQDPDIPNRYNDYKIVFNNKLYFTAKGQLWQSDGTTSGTVLLNNYAYFNAKYFKIFNGKLYFTAQNGINGTEIWSTDGTVAGTTMLKDIYPGANSSILQQFDPHLTVFNNKLFFVANDGVTGFELWSTDGTAAGTNLFKDIKLTETESSIYDNGAFKHVSQYSTVNFKVYNNKMYFCANTDYTYQFNGFKLFETDGTPAGTHYISPAMDYANCSQCSPNVPNIVDARSLTVTPAGLIFAGSPVYLTLGYTPGSTISKIDASGQLSGISAISFYYGDSGTDSENEQDCFRLYNGEYYFLAGTPELYKINVTTNTVTNVSQQASLSYILFNTNFGYSKFLSAQTWNGKLYFVKADNYNGAIFTTDGTLASTTQVTKSNGNYQSTNSPTATLYKSPISFGVLNNGLYFDGASTSGAQSSLQRFYDPVFLSVKENTLNKLSVYPNPATSQINLSFENKNRNASIKIVSIVGQTVLEKKNISGSHFSIDVSSLSSGIYIVEVADGNFVQRSKFIKK